MSLSQVSMLRPGVKPMGHTPPPMPRITRPADWPDFKQAARSRWNREEAIRELDAYLSGRAYVYQPPREEWFIPGVGYVRPPTGAGGSAVTAHRSG